MRLALIAASSWAIAASPASVSAAPDAGGPETDPIVVQVGSAVVRASELAFYLGRLHEFERQGFGQSPEQVKRGFVERRLVPELLFSEEARRRGRDRDGAVSEHIRAQLITALKDSIQREADASLGAAEVRQYCEKNADPSTCGRDLAGYRVVLRRTKATQALEALEKKLDQAKPPADTAPLEAIEVTPSGVAAVRR